eukprot:jgi/Chrpa1/25536/Chrysochromulina_OHIO_Genome00026003-RA
MVEALKTNTTLTQLSLNGNKLGDASGCALAVSLRTNTTLAQLDLGDNELGAESGKAMVEALKTSTTLRKVTLDGFVLSIAGLTTATYITLSKKGLGDASGIVIAHLITRNPSLRQLSLYGNKLGDASGCALAVALQTSTTLAQLDLGGNELGAESGRAMVEALKTNTTLHTVTLDGFVLSIAELTLLKNNLDVESATMLAKIGAERGIMHSGMKRDQTEVSFFNQSLQPADAILIGSDLQFMAALTILDLSFNNIGDEGAKAIAEALQVNTVLTKLNLKCSSMGEAGQKAVRDAVKDRSGFELELEEMYEALESARQRATAEIEEGERRLYEQEKQRLNGGMMSAEFEWIQQARDDGWANPKMVASCIFYDFTRGKAETQEGAPLRMEVRHLSGGGGVG